MSGKRLDLMPDGPLARIDRAVAIVRRAGLEPLLLALSAGALPAILVVAFFWLERVEGVFEVRPLLSAGLIGAFGLRSVLLSRVCRTYVEGLWPGVVVPPGAGQPSAVMRTAFVVSFGLIVWGAICLALTILGPFAVLLVTPFLALRGFWAPGWLARAACTEDAGVRCWIGAAADNHHQRGEGFVVELLVVFGVVGLTANLLLAVGFVLLLVRAFFGIELALLDQFLSPRNAFALLGTALAAMVLLEPLRAALSAIVFVDARVRSEGLDVRAAIDAAIEHTEQRGRKRARAAQAAALLLVLFAPARGLAQPAADTERLATDPVLDEADLAHDAEVNARAARILEGPEYEEFADSRGRGLRELLSRWLDALLSDPDEGDPTAVAGPGASIPLPGPAFFLVVGVLFALAVALFLFLRHETPLPAAPTAAATAPKVEDPRERAPRDWLAQANALAEAGRYREALRALYLATLVALDRRQILSFDPTLTNWQYLRQIRDAPIRSDFRELTRLFDHKWYGHEPTDQVDFDLCRHLAERMVVRMERAAAQEAA